MTLFNSPEPLTKGSAGIPHNLVVPILCTYRKSVFISANFGDMGYRVQTIQTNRIALFYFGFFVYAVYL